MPPSALRRRRCTASETTIIHFVSVSPRPPEPAYTALRPPAPGTLSAANALLTQDYVSHTVLCSVRIRAHVAARAPGLLLRQRL
jgi:hypothetical protein